MIVNSKNEKIEPVHFITKYCYILTGFVLYKALKITACVLSNIIELFRCPLLCEISGWGHIYKVEVFALNVFIQYFLDGSTLCEATLLK